MPIAEWENLYKLISPEGELLLNDPASPDGYYVTAKDSADSGTDIRSTGDPVPQGFGTIWHRGFTNGYVIKTPIQYWINTETPANKNTTPTAQQMDDLLMRHYRSIMAGGGRLLYNPAGQPQRLADSLFAITKPVLVEGDAFSASVVEFGSEFPYLIDFNQHLDTISSGTPTVTLANDGSAPYDPVFKVHGPFSSFILSNVTTGKEIIYDAGLPGAVAVGGGDYIEITTFRNTVYLNGSGASRKAGIDILNSDFFTLEVGDNDIQTGGADTPTVDILWAPAWF